MFLFSSYTDAMPSIAMSQTARGHFFSRWIRFLARRYGADEDGTDLLALTGSHSEQKTLSEIAAKNRWHLRLTQDPKRAIDQLHETASGVILCDRDFAGVDWRSQMR